MISRGRSVFLALSAALVSAQGTIDNSASYSSLMARAVPLSGVFTISSESTGNTLTYTHSEQPNMFPSPNTVEKILDELAGQVSEPVASQSFTLTPSTKDKSTIVANQDALKCLASQWQFSVGRDGYAVAYGCDVGPYANMGSGSGTLEDTKQYFLFVPADGDSSSSGSGSGSESAGDVEKEQKVATSASASTTSEDNDTEDDTDSSSACDKPADWVFRHSGPDYDAFYSKHPGCKGTGEAPTCSKDQAWLQAHSDYVDEHEECKAVLEGSAKRSVSARHGQRGAHRRRLAEKRDATTDGGRYYMVLLDHLTDMATRAVSANPTKAFADADAAEIVPFVEGQEDLVWTVRKVSD